MSIKDIADILFRQRTLFFGGIVLIAAIVGGLAWWAGPKYQSEMLILLKNDRPDPIVAPNQSLTIAGPSEVTEAQIATEVELLSSRELLLKVIDRCGLAKGVTSQQDSGAAVEAAARKLEKRLKIVPGIKSNLIKVSYWTNSPEGAVKVLRALMDVYLDKHLEIHRLAGGYTFFRDQADRYARELREAQARMAQYEMRTKVVVLDEQKSLSLKKLTDLETELEDAEATAREAQQKSQKIQSQLAALSDRITTQSRVMPNQYSVERLNTMLVDLRNKRTEMLVKFRPDDRLVTEIDEQIHQTEAALEKAIHTQAKEEATDVNPIRQSLETELLQNESRLAGLTAKAEALRTQVDAYKRDLDKLGANTAEHDELARNIKEAETRYLLYSRQFQDAQIAAEMDQQRMANLAIAEQPRFPLTAQSKITLPTLLTLVLAVLAWVGLLFVRGIRRKHVFTPWELEGLVSVPVLGAVPEGASEHTVLIEATLDPLQRRLLRGIEK
ncbi:MAG: Wzz/FepE/Etk N-terminal domain-containing protein [Bryobacteraceae bacterium]